MTHNINLKLDNIKYALIEEGGGWESVHHIFLIENNGNVYVTDKWIPEKVIPTESLDVVKIGTVDDSFTFTIPQNISRAVMDAPFCTVYDGSLSDPIYDGFGVEDEFTAYFSVVHEQFYEYKKNCPSSHLRVY